MLKISKIKIDNLTDGCVTDQKPNISFSLDSDRQDEALEKAEITVGNWRVVTTDQLNNPYRGDLKQFTEYKVHIVAFGKSGDRAEATTTFATGRLDTPWKAEWITDASYQFGKKVSPAPMTFRYQFPIIKQIRKAWVNATALGVYELMLNGDKVGQDYFAPGFTAYEHQIQYQTYELTHQLKKSNQIIAVVAGGWAVGSFNYKRKNKTSADRQAFLCEIYLEYEDGTRDIIGTDTHWEVTVDGHYRMAEWYDGETYDATVNLETVAWKQADITKPRKNPKLLAQYGPPVRIQEIMKPVSCTKAPSGEMIYDFGQNFAGVIHAKINGKQGQTIVFRHAEILFEDELFVKSLRTAKATATYRSVDGNQVYSPKLTYMGFRYVGVQGISPEDLELSALVLHSELPEIGYFESSNELVNQLQSNIRWGGKSNFVDIPTDCPQRDERQGWTGDFAVFASTAVFNFDMSRFIDKWLLDMRSEQGRGGGFPMVIPRGGDGWPAMATSAWGDASILVPWAEYLARGDKRLLERQYPAIQKFLKAAKWWASFLSLSPNSRYIWRFPFHFGDWCAPGENIKQWLAKGKWVATAYFANSCRIAAQIAEILGEQSDAEYYRGLRTNIVKAYRKVFTNGAGTLKKEFQTGYVLPLHFDMTEGIETKNMVDNLVKLVREADNHLTTGFTGTPYLLFALSDHGYIDVAYELLLQESCPSWLYQVKAGATTLWERWDALRPDGSVNIGDLTGNKSDEQSEGGMVSFNHYANGAVGDWLYRRVAGIEALSGGYKTFRIKPIIGGDLNYAKASVLTPFGQITSHWRIEENVFIIDVEVPVSTKCKLVLPNNDNHTLDSGQYQFSCEMS